MPHIYGNIYLHLVDFYGKGRYIYNIPYIDAMGFACFYSEFNSEADNLRIWSLFINSDVRAVKRFQQSQAAHWVVTYLSDYNMTNNIKIQGGPLLVINGVTTLINGRK